MPVSSFPGSTLEQREQQVENDLANSFAMIGQPILRTQSWIHATLRKSGTAILRRTWSPCRAAA